MQERMYKLDKDIYAYLKENDMKIDKQKLLSQAVQLLL